MATSVKKIPAGMKPKISKKSDYATSTIKGKGTSKKQDVKAAKKNCRK